MIGTIALIIAFTGAVTIGLRVRNEVDSALYALLWIFAITFAGSMLQGVLL